MANELSAAELRAAAVVCEHLNAIAAKLSEHDAFIDDNRFTVSSEYANGLNGEFYYTAEADCWVYTPSGERR